MAGSPRCGCIVVLIMVTAATPLRCGCWCWLWFTYCILCEFQDRKLFLIFTTHMVKPTFRLGRKSTRYLRSFFRLRRDQLVSSSRIAHHGGALSRRRLIHSFLSVISQHDAPIDTRRSTLTTQHCSKSSCSCSCSFFLIRD